MAEIFLAEQQLDNVADVEADGIMQEGPSGR